jgi:hypothetical protein
MIVRREGAAASVVLQVDHDDVAGVLAEAWVTGPLYRPLRAASVIVAAARHDEGWAAWESRPRVDPMTGRPWHFADMHVREHLDFFRVAIAQVAADDGYAGVLVSMHASGLYLQRFSTDRTLSLTRRDAASDALVNTFLSEQRDWRAGLVPADVGDAELWADYRVLQVADRLSLWWCLGGARPADLVMPAAPGRDGADVQLTARSTGPWRARLTPYPLGVEPLTLRLTRRLLPDRDWTGDHELRAALAATQAEDVEIVLHR